MVAHKKLISHSISFDVNKCQILVTLQGNESESNTFNVATTQVMDKSEVNTFPFIFRFSP